MLDVAVIVEPAWTSAGDWETIAATAVEAAIRRDCEMLLDAPAVCEIAVRLADNDTVRALNAAYRDKDKTTNVLSFPQDDRVALERDAALLPELMIGDLILAHDVCVAEAAGRGIALAEHVTHLVVHGTLHLLGHDHVDETAAEAMEGLETEIMGTLGYADPYRHDAGQLFTGQADTGGDMIDG